MTRLKHVLAFLVAAGAAVAPAWLDPQQTWAGRVAVTVVTMALLGFSTAKMKSYKNAIMVALALGGGVVAALAGRFTAGTGGFAVAGFVAAVYSQIRAILPAAIDSGTVGAIPTEAKPASNLTSAP
jgi:hypothetical protein